MIGLNGREFQCGPDILGFQVRKIREDFRFRYTRRKQVEDVFHANAHPADARPAAALLGIDRDPVQVAHGPIIYCPTSLVHLEPRAIPRFDPQTIRRGASLCPRLDGNACRPTATGTWPRIRDMRIQLQFQPCSVTGFRDSCHCCR